MGFPAGGRGGRWWQRASLGAWPRLPLHGSQTRRRGLLWAGRSHTGMLGRAWGQGPSPGLTQAALGGYTGHAQTLPKATAEHGDSCRGGWEGTRVRGGAGLPGSPAASPAPGHLRSPPQGLCTCCSHPFPRVWPAPPCHSGMGSRVTSPWWRLASSGLCPPRDRLDFPVVPLAACHVGTSPAWPAAPWAWSCPPRTRRRCAPEACPCWTVSQASRDPGSSVPPAARALEPQL